ncbi:TPA: hypothetical protein OZK91_002645, partial [Legionella pneumophila]|nr:hypothetical protein [Legionella pneumophila]HCJ4392505.1 hypothetical protein [Legionella pneumophila]HCX3359348.1 hypothetical protein [Legionella pneumophila]
NSSSIQLPLSSIEFIIGTLLKNNFEQGDVMKEFYINRIDAEEDKDEYMPW